LSKPIPERIRTLIERKPVGVFALGGFDAELFAQRRSRDKETATNLDCWNVSLLAAL